MPAIPLRPGTPGATGTPSRTASRAASPSKREDDNVIAETPTKKSKGVASKVLDQEKPAIKDEAESKNKSSESKENEKPTAKSGSNKTTRSVADVVKSKKEDKQSVADIKPDTTEQPLSTKAKKGKAAEEKVPAVSPVGQSAKESAISQKEDSKPVSATPAKADGKLDSTKRKHPGKLDIAAAVEKQAQATSSNAVSTTTPADIGTPIKQLRNVSQPPSVPSVPASPNASIPSPAFKTAPRTLRVVQTATPKAEAPPAVQSMSTPPAAAFSKLPSRKPSVASMNLPGTPSSEHVSMSDNVSMTSTSQSRANSPPPVGGSRVGSAPIREKTKSQQKKDRQERAKAKEEEERAKLLREGNAIAEEPAQEAIVSRKKKEKKEKAPKPVKVKEVRRKLSRPPPIPRLLSVVRYRLDPRRKRHPSKSRLPCRHLYVRLPCRCNHPMNLPHRQHQLSAQLKSSPNYAPQSLKSRKPSTPSSALVVQLPLSQARTSFPKTSPTLLPGRPTSTSSSPKTKSTLSSSIPFLPSSTVAKKAVSGIAAWLLPAEPTSAL